MKNAIPALATLATFAGSVHSQTFSYADVTPSGGTTGSTVVAGTLGGVGVSFNGIDSGDFQEIGNLSAVLFTPSFDSWTPTVDGTEDIFLDRGDGALNISFAQSVLNPIIYFGNLGNSDGGSLTFDEPFNLVSSTGVTLSNQTITSFDNSANGVVQFSGLFDSLSFSKLRPATSMNPDQVFFQVGFDPAPVPEPSSSVLLGLGALGSLARRKRSLKNLR